MSLWVLLIVVLFSACSSSSDEVAAAEVTIPENVLTKGITFGKNGGDQSLSISSNVALTVSSDAAWCTVTEVTSTSQTVHKYTVTAQPNTDTSDRTAIITVKSPAATEGSFTVTQSATEGLVVGEPLYNVAADGGTLQVTISTNGDPTVTISHTWVEESSTRAMDDRTYTFNVLKNVAGERTATITFTLGELAESVTVTQAAALSEGGMESDACTLAAKMYAGVNIGNTLESPGGEGSWGNPKVTRTYIQGLKKLGFNAVRIPCAWDSHVTDEASHTIDPTWLDRVHEVVGYCVENDMYVVLNIHWDGGWLEDNILGGVNDAINEKQRSYWTQIANKMNDYDEHLLFAGMNEPGMNETTSTGNTFKDPNDILTIMTYQQTFLDAVRATGGNNAKRCLVMQAPGTRIDDCLTTYELPTDVVADRLMVEVHYYDPYQFCLMSEDASWGKTFWYWGSQNYVTGSEHNATGGEEEGVKTQLAKMKAAYADKGIPAIIGEYSAMKRTDVDNQQKHNDSRAYWNKVVTREAKNNGCVPFYWETGTDVNRTTGAANEAYAIDGLMEGAAAGQYPF